MQYAINALAFNEMSAPRWATPLTFGGTTRTMGEWVLINSGLFTESYWRWMPALMLVGYWFLFTTITFLVLQYAPREMFWLAVVLACFPFIIKRLSRLACRTAKLLTN